MRLLYVADTRFPLERANGIQTFETCHALASLGHEVELLVREDTHRPPRDPFAYYGAPPLERFRVHAVRTFGSGPARRAAFLAAAIERVTRAHAHLCFTRDLGVASAVLWLPRAVRPPLVYESHGHAAVVGADLAKMLTRARGASASKQRRLRARERRVWLGADGYLTITALLADELAQAFGPRRHLAVVADGARPRPSIPPPPGPFRAGYAGHLYPWKGVDTLVRALVDVDGAEGLIVGGHEAEPDLARVRELVESAGLSSRVRLTGMVAPSDVAAHLASTHVLVLPNSGLAVSARYTSPLKLFEYLWAGRAIVASDLPAFREVLQDGVHALLVPPDDPASLAAALRRLRDDREERERLSSAAAALAPRFSWEARARRIEALAAAVLGRNAATERADH